MNDEYSKFKALTYEQFKDLALDETLNDIEKVGFPIKYRKNKEELILNDIISKLGLKGKRNKTILDIGCGCSKLTTMLIDYCKLNEHKLILIDSQEMLNQLPEYDFVNKVEGYYPSTCEEFIKLNSKKIDFIITYSVIQYVFNELNIFDFIDRSISLLKEEGRMLIGDIPNISKRKRFFSSEEGIKFHKDFTNKNEVPKVEFNNIEFNNIDDSVVMSIIQRCRLSGFDAYLLPQDDGLPMANRREDIMIIRP